MRTKPGDRSPAGLGKLLKELERQNRRRLDEQLLRTMLRRLIAIVSFISLAGLLLHAMSDRGGAVPVSAALPPSASGARAAGALKDAEAHAGSDSYPASASGRFARRFRVNERARSRDSARSAERGRQA
mmetsp:Transcript_13797/g.31661  ORF Transcript_13797/g.31661 Transcript_13797/m.31661 type:complete len:129 (-) Transcript_13797:196-582(-)